MRQLPTFLLLIFLFLAFSANAQVKPVHPADLYDCMGKSIKWADRFIRSSYGEKAEKINPKSDTVQLKFYSEVSDVEVTLFFVNEECEFIGFSDFSLTENEVNTYFTRWCDDVTEHYRLLSEKEEKFPMFEDRSYNMVFFIPEDQRKGGIQYFMFSGFIRGEKILSVN